MVDSGLDVTKRRWGWERLEIDPDALPDDPEQLKLLLYALVEHANALSDRGLRLDDRLRMELARRYGRRSERSENGPRQLRLFGDNPEPEASKAEAEAETQGDDEESEEESQRPASSKPRKHKKKNGRRPLPDNLPRVRRMLELDEQERTCTCCNEVMVEIGREVSEQLEHAPARYFVIETVRPKYACKRCHDGVLTAEPPAAPISKGLAGPGLLAHIVTSKHCDHLPLYRQEAIFARHGIDLNRSTMSDWIGRCAQLLTPLYERMKAEVLAGRSLHVDETPVRVQRAAQKRRKRGRKSRHRTWDLERGYVWTYVGDAAHPFTVYDYTPSRGRAGPARFLAGFRGHVHADDYAGYRELFRTGERMHVACWAHVRRKFHDARATDKARAEHAIAQIGRLYAIERRMHDAPAEQRLAARQEEAKPIVEELQQWLRDQGLRVLPKSPIGSAIKYALKLWPALVRYLEDPQLEIDNNAAERAIKPLAIGRKNWLFAGSDDGARHGAILFSFVTTCKRHKVDPYAYLRDLFARLPRYRGDLVDLLPHRWSPAYPAEDLTVLDA